MVGIEWIGYGCSNAVSYNLLDHLSLSPIIFWTLSWAFLSRMSKTYDEEWRKMAMMAECYSVVTMEWTSVHMEWSMRAEWMCYHDRFPCSVLLSCSTVQSGLTLPTMTYITKDTLLSVSTMGMYKFLIKKFQPSCGNVVSQRAPTFLLYCRRTDRVSLTRSNLLLQGSWRRGMSACYSIKRLPSWSAEIFRKKVL